MSTDRHEQRRAAVDRVRAELAALPELPMPPDVADRIGRALDHTADARSPRSAGTRAGALLGAAACLVALVAGAAGAGSGTPRPVARHDDLRSSGATAFGHDGAGPLADRDRRRSCLAGAGVPEPEAALLGGAPATLNGTPGTLLVLGTAVTGRYRVVVVDPGCTRVLGQDVIGH